MGPYRFENFRWPELAGKDMTAARQQGIESGAQIGEVKHRRGVQMDIGRPIGHRTDDVDRIRQEIVVAEDDTLGQAGGAAGIEYAKGRACGQVGELWRRFPPVDPSVQRRALQRFGLAIRIGGVVRGPAGIFHKTQREIGIFDLVGQFLGGEAVVEGHRHCAEARRGQEQFKKFPPVGGQEADAVAGAYAAGAKCAGKSVHAHPHLGPGPAPVRLQPQGRGVRRGFSETVDQVGDVHAQLPQAFARQFRALHHGDQLLPGDIARQSGEPAIRCYG